MHSSSRASIEHVDVLIVGAPASPALAPPLPKDQCSRPRHFAIVEARYPAIPTDSDLHTFSYEFKRGSTRRRPPARTPGRSLAGEIEHRREHVTIGCGW